MKSVKQSVLAVAAFLSVATATAQTADEIVAKHVDAMGGKDKISGIKSLRTEGTVSIMGQEAPITVVVMNGKGYRSDVDFGGQKFVNAMNDKGGWMINPMMGGTDAQALPADQYNAQKDQLSVGGPLFDYAAQGNKIELQGKEKVGGNDAYKLKVTSKDNSVSTYYIDPATHYIVKVAKTANMGGQEGTVEVLMSNYKKTDYGYVVPYTIETTLPQGFSMTANISKVEINGNVDPAIFDMPKP